MDTLVSVIHVITALVLIALVLVQDSKGDSLGGSFGGGGGSNSLLGATGATTLVQKATRWTAVVFAATSLSLTLMSKNTKSVIDSYAPSATTQAPGTPATTPANAAAATPGSAPAPKTASAATATSSSPSTTVAPKK